MSPADASGQDPAVAIDAGQYVSTLLAWFDIAGRHDLPWQHPRTPYRVWLSEIMLQQTQVSVVVPYFQRFVAALPDLPALAAAPPDQVLALWSGLGYYARGRNLHAAARACMDLHGGTLPRDHAALLALPGIGRSTAGAILAQAWGDRAAILDGNVKRVLARVHGIAGWPGLPAVEARLWAIAEAALPDARLADYTQAQMDFGATLCTRAAPACVICPLQDACVARREGRVAELPTRKPARAVPQREATVLVAFDGDGRVLLARRPTTGVWATLWSLPQAETTAMAAAWHDAHLAAEASLAGSLSGTQPGGAPAADAGATATGADPLHDALPLDPIEHAFTHYRLRLLPLRLRARRLRDGVGDNDALRWVAADDIAALGIPAPVRSLLLAEFARHQEESGR